MDGENEQGLERLQWNRVGKANAWSLPDRTMSHCAESKAFDGVVVLSVPCAISYASAPGALQPYTLGRSILARPFDSQSCNSLQSHTIPRRPRIVLKAVGVLSTFLRKKRSSVHGGRDHLRLSYCTYQAIREEVNFQTTS